jgi:hypothetical protein
MFKRWAASLLVLALCAVGPASAAAQGSSRGTIGNVPNPINPSTTVAFTVGDVPCKDPTQQHVVTIRIYNVLGQLEGVPILQGSGSGASQGGSVGRRVEGMRLTCGSYSAFWDGKNSRTGQEVASGTYVIFLEIDRRRVAEKRIMVSK